MILREESEEIERNIQSLQKPKGKAEENIKKAKELLQKELPPLQERTQENITKSKEKAKKQVESTINKWIEQEFTNKVEEIVLKAVIFMHKSAEGIKNPAKQIENFLRELSNKEKQNYLKEVTLRIKGKKEKDSIHYNTNEYISSLIENCKNNFLDIQSEIKCYYVSLNAQCNESLQDFKSAIKKRFNLALQMEFKEQIQPIAIDYLEVLNLSTSIPKSTLSYTFKEAQYKEVEKDWTIWKPWTIFWREKELKKASNEEHILTINPKELQQAITSTFTNRTAEFKAMEIKRHQDAISAFGSKTLQKAIKEIAESKIQEINKLGEQLQDAQSNLEKSQRQQKALTNTQEKMGF